jgi:putative PIN family toxin of toxin-antitoxin system
MRIVADTNVLVSALVFPGGAPETVYRLALTGVVQLVTSRPLLLELARVLVEKFAWDAGRAERAVAQVVRLAVVAEPTERVEVVSADPADDRVLEAARAGAVDAIVSGDRHLLALASWSGIEILTPAQLVARAGAA